MPSAPKPPLPQLPRIPQLSIASQFLRPLRSTSRLCPTMSIEIPATRRAQNQPWISTNSIQNALRKNHFLDFLELHGRLAGFTPDDEAAGFDPSANHSIRQRGLSREFRRQVTGAFVRRIGDVACVPPVTAGHPTTDLRNLTKQFMADRRPLIVGAILADEERRIWAKVPMLIRADLVAEMPSTGDINLDASLKDLYVAVGTKRSSVKTDARNVVKRNVFKSLDAEMWWWNRLLTKAQGADVCKALVIGLNPNRRKPVAMGAFPTSAGAAGLNGLFDTEVWKLAQVECKGEQCEHGIAAVESLAWRVQVADHGEEWISAVKKKIGPSGKTTKAMRDMFLGVVRSAVDSRLRPNMKVDGFYDFPWAKAKRQVAISVNELTLVSRIGVKVIQESMAKGLPNDFENPSVDADALGIEFSSVRKLLEMCKPTYNGALVLPSTIPHNRFNWRRLQGFKSDVPHIFDKKAPLIPGAEERTFYVDLELTNPDMLYADNGEHGREDGRADVSNQFFDEEPTIPVRRHFHTVPLIFMIGCGQVVDGDWRHRVFIASTLSRKAESAILREWLEYMNSLDSSNLGQPLLNVWGPERRLLKSAMKAMNQEDATAVKDIRSFQVVDIHNVAQTGGLTIKGCFKNSLKSVAKSLGKYGLLDDFIGRGDDDLVCNGEDVMAAALDCVEYAERHDLRSLSDAPKMGQIVRYNEADCRDIARIVTYLRENH